MLSGAVGYTAGNRTKIYLWNEVAHGKDGRALQ
jgi:hypothetical protein